MTLKRPEPGAPWDKRLDAATLADVLARGPRPFEAGRDVDLWDAIEDYLREKLLSPVALSPYLYASSQHAVNEPETGWTLTSTPLEDTALIPSALPFTYTGAVAASAGYRFGVAGLDVLPQVGASHTLTVDLPLPTYTERVSVHFVMPGYVGDIHMGTVGGASGSGSRFQAKDTRYHVRLIGPDGSTVAERLGVGIVSAGRVVSKRYQSVYMIAGSFASQEEFPSVAAIDLDLGRVLPAGQYGVQVELAELQPLSQHFNSTVKEDFNCYPAARALGADGQGAPSLLTVSRWPGAAPDASGAVAFILRPQRPQVFSVQPDHVRAEGAQLIRVGTPLGPSGSMTTRFVCEFTVEDDALAQTWGGQFAVLASRFPDARFEDERDELVKAACSGFVSGTVYLRGFPPAHDSALALSLYHPPLTPGARWSNGLQAGKKYRLEATHSAATSTYLANSGSLSGGGSFTAYGSRRTSALAVKLYDDAGALVYTSSKSREVSQRAEDAGAESWRMALVLPPASTPLVGLAPALTIHTWREWRE